MKNFQKIDVFLIAIFLVGIILRFWSYADWSLTNDELSALYRVNYNSLTDLFQHGIWVDGHPAFVQLFLYFWVKIAGNSALALRLPFVLAGIGSLFYFYGLAKHFLNKNAAILSLSIFSVSQLYILYAQIARPYSFGLFFTLGFSYHLTLLYKNPKAYKQLLFSVLFGLLASVSHYFSALQIALIFLIGIPYLNRLNYKKIILSAILIILLYLPHLPITLNHLQIGGVGWLPRPEPEFIKNFIYFHFNKSWLFLSVCIFSVIILFFKSNREINFKKLLTSLFLFSSTYLIGYYYSIYRVPVIQYSVLIFCAPFLILFINSFVADSLKKIWVIGISVMIIAVGSFQLIYAQQFYSKKPFANFKEVVQLSLEKSLDLGRKNVLTLGNANNANYLNYYINQYDSSFNFDISNFNSIDHVVKARDKIEQTNQEYILIAFANSPVPAEIHEFAKERFTQVKFHRRFFNSEIIIYQKSTLERPSYFSTNFSDYKENTRWNLNEEHLMDTLTNSESPTYHLPTHEEYALTFKDTLKNITSQKHPNFIISTSLKGNVGTNFTIVCSITRGDTTVFWRGVETAPYITDKDLNKIIVVFQKTEAIKPNDLVTVFIWNNYKNQAIIHDFKLVNFIDSDYNYYDL